MGLKQVIVGSCFPFGIACVASNVFFLNDDGHQKRPHVQFESKYFAERIAIESIKFFFSVLFTLSSEWKLWNFLIFIELMFCW